MQTRSHWEYVRLLCTVLACLLCIVPAMLAYITPDSSCLLDALVERAHARDDAATKCT
jgi:hypothetical protein